MGRHAGFIAMEACNASREANVCLIPEFKFDLYGEFGLLEYIHKRLRSRGRAVVVVAEGAGEVLNFTNIRLYKIIKFKLIVKMPLETLRLRMWG